LSGTYSERITTEVTAADRWWPAEKHHQQCLKKLAERKPEIRPR
jgi:peptide methionine sulfoxide reductase MsrA